MDWRVDLSGAIGIRKTVGIKTMNIKTMGVRVNAKL